MRDPLTTLSAAGVGLLALTRATRLLVDDDYPPIERFRRWWVGRAGEAWGPLVECPWCAAPYLAAPAVAWYGSLIAFPNHRANQWAWWLVNGWAAASWVAAFLTVRDIPPDQR